MEELQRSISIDPEKCTGCGACALKCPREAIRIQDEGFLRRLIFDPQKCDFCLGIPICVSICPENAIEPIERPLNSEAQVLEFEIMPCAECGKPTGI
ncbi:MAG TPA: 4Fe-4S dicluster domain-containing protein, partial [Euryarchaeota archaeon]|nr:4Fe-4S dicluster domain-containing protein [Euryarchaeota archaeon]